MAEDSGANNHPATKSSDLRTKQLALRTVGTALLIVAAAGGIWLAHGRGVFASLGAKLQALPQSPSWDLWIAGLFAVLGLLGVLVLWKVPQWQVAGVRGLSRKEQFDKRNEARKTIATILGGIAFLTGGYFTWRNFNLAQENLKVTEQGQITDRYTKAIEQIGAVDSGRKPKLEVRLGAIYSLEAVANESRNFHWPIMEVLCTYVRVNAPAKEEESHANAAHTAGARPPTKRELPGDTHPAADIQAILTVLGRREHREWELDKQRLDLNHTNLRGADLREAHLEDAILFGADLTLANLSHAHLDGADLGYADLFGAQLSHAHLDGADLGYADLDEADLRGADFSGADLSSADLSDAKYLTQEQVDSADGDDYTKLPTDRCVPIEWDEVRPDNPRVCPAPK